MRDTMAIKTKARPALAAVLLASAMLLSSCSGRDTELAEKTSAAEQQAMRAEKAADRAEAAADKVERAAAPAPVVAADAAAPDGTSDGTTPLEIKPLDPTPTDKS